MYQFPYANILLLYSVTKYTLLNKLTQLLFSQVILVRSQLQPEHLTLPTLSMYVQHLLPTQLSCLGWWTLYKSFSGKIVLRNILNLVFEGH